MLATKAGQSDTGLTILVVGSLRPISDKRFQGFRNACQALGAALAGSGLTIVAASYNEETADRHVIKGAKLVKGQVQVVGPASSLKKYKKELQGISVTAVEEDWAEIRRLQVKRADAVLAIGGADHTDQAIDIAESADLPVLLIPAFEGVASRRYRDARDLYLKAGIPGDILASIETWSDDSPNAVVQALHMLSSPSPLDLASESVSDSDAEEELASGTGTGTDSTSADDGIDKELPLVYISYSREDEHWKNQIIEVLQGTGLESDFAVWHDGLLETGEEWELRLRNIRSSAVAVVVVIRARYPLVEI